MEDLNLILDFVERLSTQPPIVILCFALALSVYANYRMFKESRIVAKRLGRYRNNFYWEYAKHNNLTKAEVDNIIIKMDEI